MSVPLRMNKKQKGLGHPFSFSPSQIGDFWAKGVTPLRVSPSGHVHQADGPLWALECPSPLSSLRSLSACLSLCFPAVRALARCLPPSLSRSLSRLLRWGLLATYIIYIHTHTHTRARTHTHTYTHTYTHIHTHTHTHIHEPRCLK